MTGFYQMSILPPGMDAASMARSNSLQNWQENGADRLPRTAPRGARRTRGGILTTTIRTVTPEFMDDETNGSGSSFTLSSHHTSPRSIPGADQLTDRKQVLFYSESYTKDAPESAPRTGPPLSFHAQSRPRTRTMEEPARNRSTSHTTARSRHRISSMSSSVHESEPKGTPESLMSPGVPALPSRTGYQPLQKSNSLKKDRIPRRLMKRSRQSSPSPGFADAPSVDSFPFPVSTGDAPKIIGLMQTLCGRMKGDVEFQIGEDGLWQQGMCYIDDGTGSLFFEGTDCGPFHTPIIRELRGCRVRPTTLRNKPGRCLEISHQAGVRVHLIPMDTEYEWWLSALLCFQQIRTGRLLASPRTAALPSLESFQLPRRTWGLSSPSSNIIKVAKLLFWDKGSPSSPFAVIKRPSTREVGNPNQSWRRVSCILQDNGDFKLLTENDVTLLSTIQLTQLSRCAIQRLDKSVLGEDHCIAILPQYISNSTQLSIFRPVYIALESRLLLEVWYCLLRAFCVPDIYGPPSCADIMEEQGQPTPDEGMFRIEKSLSIRITEAKIRLPVPKTEKLPTPYSGKHSTKAELDPSVGDYLAEVILDGEVRARTITKTETRNPFWREDYEFNDLPAYLPRVSVVVKRIDQQVATKGASSSSSILMSDPGVEVVCGSLNVFTDQLEKGKDVEKWSEILDDQRKPIGEIFLRIWLDEVVVMMAKDYQNISELLHNMNSGLTQRIAQAIPTNLKKLTEILINIFQVSGQAGEWLMNLVEDEIDGVGKEAPLTHRLRWSRRMGSNESFGSSSDREQTVRALGRSLDSEASLLFRGNSLLTQSLDFHMRRLGKEYLEEVLSEKIIAINALNSDCEVDPSRLSPGDDLERNWTSLIALTTDVWEGISESPRRCPAELRQILKYIRSCAEDRFGDYLRSAPYTSISGFLFLRFFCPAILNPKLFGLLPEHPHPKTQRTLTLIAKSLQALANLSTFGKKEAWMEPMNRFLSGHRQDLKDFFDVICSIPTERSSYALPASYSTPITILARLPPTSREGFPSLPHLIDHARNFAALVKLWISSRPHDFDALDQEANGVLKEFNQKCIDIQRRTDRCLTLAQAKGGKTSGTVNLQPDDVVESIQETTVQEVELPPHQPDAEIPLSPRGEDEARSLQPSPPQDSPSREVDDDRQYPRSQTFDQFQAINPGVAISRPATSHHNRINNSNSIRDRRAKERKRHSLTFVKDRDMSGAFMNGNGSAHKNSHSETGLISLLSPVKPVTSIAKLERDDGERDQGPYRNGKQGRSFLGGLMGRKEKERDRDQGKERRREMEERILSPKTPRSA